MKRSPRDAPYHPSGSKPGSLDKFSPADRCQYGDASGSPQCTAESFEKLAGVNDNQSKDHRCEQNSLKTFDVFLGAHSYERAAYSRIGYGLDPFRGASEGKHGERDQ